MADLIPPLRTEVITERDRLTQKNLMTLRLTNFFEAIARNVNLLLSQIRLTSTTTVSATAKAFSVIICKNTTSINITLDPAATLNDIVDIKRTDAEVIVIGQIDGFTNKTINVQFYSIRLIYDGSEWWEI